MMVETVGTVVSVSRQWWLKINTKPLRRHALDGALFPHIIKVSYAVNGTVCTRRKWVHAGMPVPGVGSRVKVVWPEGRPEKARIII